MRGFKGLLGLGVSRRGGVLLFVLCATLLVGAAPASAALTFPFDGQLAPAAGSFGTLGANSVAVDDANGDTYVADSASGTVDVFDTATGTQLAGVEGSLQGSSTPAGSFGGGEVAVAANDATGDVYVMDPRDNVVDVFASSGGYVCQITGSATPSATECNKPGGSATPAGAFRELHGITVDQATGDVYVLDVSVGEPDSSVVDIFSREGAYLRQVKFSSIPGGLISGGPEIYYAHGLAVDDFSGDVYVSSKGDIGVYEFDAAGEWVATWNGSNTPAGSFGHAELSIAADNASGEVYVTSSLQQVTDVFDASGGYVAQFSHAFSTPRGTAVDQATGRVYISNDEPAVVDVLGPALVVPSVTTGAAAEVRPTSATLNGTVDPDGLELKGCRFEYGTEAGYGLSAPCEPAASAIPADSSEHAVTAHITDLRPGTTYHFRLVAWNANDASEPNVGVDAVFSTPPPPAVEDAAAVNVTGSSADLTARVNPNGFDTTYHFEWGTSTGYGTAVPAPDADVGAGASGVPVATHLSGLSANTTYHWRVAAQNSNGTTVGVDHTFIYSTAGGALPDNRAYEMVTPVQKNAALIGGIFDGVFPFVSEDGLHVILSSIQCFAGAGSCTSNRLTTGEPFEFTRTSEGWVTSALAPPAAQFEANTAVFASASGMALFSMPPSSGAQDDWYARQPDGSFVDIGPVTLPADGSGYGPGNAQATADDSHVVWSITGGYWPFDATNESQVSLYQYVGAGNTVPVLVGVSGGAGSTDLISRCGTTLPSASGNLSDMSVDGSVVFFFAAACSSGSGANAGVGVPARELWARVDGSRSVWVSARSLSECTGACLDSSASEPQFIEASEDGSKVFFTSNQQLTNGASQGSTNLYEYDFANPTGHNLIDVSADDDSNGGPRVQGVMSVSEDGSHAYFVAQSVLSAGANERGQVARDGGENLYVFERDAAHPEGHIAFIATLPAADHHEWENEGVHSRNVTPDGQFVVFRSHGLLTADDTSLSGAAQVFRYDAQTAQLVRISIGDQGFNDDGNRSAATPCARGVCSEDAGTALVYLSSGVRLDPTMSNDGSYVFFESPVALTPRALDDVQIGADEHGMPIYAQNVYEYHEGRVYLISDGRDTGQYADVESDVKLLGTDATGANVFFTTSDPLAAQDTDTQLDVYDARVCTASEPCVSSAGPPASCQGEACHGTPGLAPVAPGVGTVTFSGLGNLTTPSAISKSSMRKTPPRCGKDKRLVRGKCVKRRSKKVGAKRAKSSKGGKK